MENYSDNQLSDFELSKVRELVILYINKDASEAELRKLLKDPETQKEVRNSIVTKRYSFYSINQVAKVTGLSRSTILRMEAAGDFPVGVELSSNRKGYLSSDVDSWARVRMLTAVGKRLLKRNSYPMNAPDVPMATYSQRPKENNI
ncbi:TPA: helix-turn-helix transcriptional regulator [Salmonella enterica]|nr:AlpA family phage regulatory protein [Salmonella enterica subsp. enterica serovar Give]